MSSNLPRSFAVVIRCCLIFLIAISTNANALTQCGFNPPLGFDPELFPNLPNGYDGNIYDSEAAALAAAK